jgi:hypothetical protein
MHGSDKKDPILDDALDALEDQLDGMPSLPDSADANSMSDDDLPSEDGIMQSGDDDGLIGQVDDDLDAMLDEPITTRKQDVHDKNVDSDKNNNDSDLNTLSDEGETDPISAPVDKMDADDFDDFLDGDEPKHAVAPVDKIDADDFDDFLDGDESKPAVAHVDKIDADDFDDFLDEDEPKPAVVPVDKIDADDFDEGKLSRLDGDDVGIPPIPDDGGDTLDDFMDEDRISDTIDNEVIMDQSDEEGVANDPINDNIVKDPLDDIIGDKDIADDPLAELLDEDFDTDPANDFIGTEDIVKDPLDDMLGEDFDTDPANDFVGTEDIVKDPLDDMLGEDIDTDPIDELIVEEGTVNSSLNDFVDNDMVEPEADIDEPLAPAESEDEDEDDWSNDMGLDELLVSGDNQGEFSDEDAISEFGEYETHSESEQHEDSKDDNDEVADLLSSLERRSKAIIEKPSPKHDDTLNLIVEERGAGAEQKLPDDISEGQATVGSENQTMKKPADKSLTKRSAAKTVGLWVMGGCIVALLVFLGALAGVYVPKMIPIIAGESVGSNDLSELNDRVLALSSRIKAVNNKVNDVGSSAGDADIVKRYEELFSTQQAMFKEQEMNRDLMERLRSQLNDYESKMLSRFEKVVTLASSVAKQQKRQSQDIKDTVLREAVAIMKSQNSATGSDSVASLQQNIDDSNRRLSQLQAQVLAQRNLMSLIETEVDYVKTRVSNDSQSNQSSPAYENVDLDFSSPNRDVTVFVDTATPDPVKRSTPEPLKTESVELSLVGVFARGAGKFDIYVQDAAQGNGTSGVKPYMYSPNQVSNIKGYGRILSVRKLDRAGLRVPYAVDTEGGVITGKR